MAENNKNFFQRIFSSSTQEVAKRTNSWGSVSSPAVTYSSGNFASNGSLTLETVFACTARISQAVAALEIETYKATSKGRDKVQHNLKNLLNQQPHSRYGAFNWWENIISDSLLWGAGYAVIQKDGTKVVGLEYIPASSVTPRTYKGEDFYIVNYTDRAGNNKNAKYSEAEMFIVRGYRGLNVFQLHRDTLDLAKYSRDFGVDYFRNGGRMAGIIEVPNEMTDEEFERFRAGWSANFSGMGNHHGTPILEAGVTYKQLNIPPEEAQFLEARKYTDQAIARIFQVPAALVGLDTNVTFSNVEQQNIFFATYTIQPLVKRIENEVYNKLLTDFEKNRVIVEFDMSSLLRADAATRSAYYSTLTTMGAMTINEVRAKEGLNPTEGGDTPLVQMNQLPLTSMNDYADNITSATQEAPVDNQALTEDTQDEAHTASNTEEEDV